MRPVRWWFSRWFGPRPLGERGERHAARLLRRKGHRVLFAGQRNRFGELDLITIDERTPDRVIVFTEVKTRKDTRGGHPAEAVTAEKQRRVERAALAFLKQYELLDHSIRFDVVAIVWPRDARKPTSAEHLVDAFH